jgi:ferritin-like metal-binding protein YciE
MTTSTRSHERVEQVLAMIDKKPQRKTCAAIVGITDEGAEIIEEYKGAPALDAGLLAAAQAASMLQETLDEEEATDEALSELARTVVNQEAEAA